MQSGYSYAQATMDARAAEARQAEAQARQAEAEAQARQAEAEAQARQEDLVRFIRRCERRKRKEEECVIS